jgi:ribosome recycling factor
MALPAGNYGDLSNKCKKTLEHFKKELGRVRTGRASASILEGIMVDYYGSRVPLNQLGMVNAPEPRLLQIQVYDAGAMEAIEKSIQSSGLGLNPMRDGALIRINIPPLTADRRKEFVRGVHTLSESQRVAIRNSRRDANEAVKADKTLSQDQSKRVMDEIQKICDAAVKEIDMLSAVKEKEIMDV